MSPSVGIAVWVSDVKQKLVSGLTAETNVQDVMVALNPHCNPATHGLFQVWQDTEEQMLRPRAKIIRILQSITEEDLSSIRFVLKKREQVEEDGRDSSAKIDSSSVCKSNVESSSCSSTQISHISSYSSSSSACSSSSSSSISGNHSHHSIGQSQCASYLSQSTRNSSVNASGHYRDMSLQRSNNGLPIKHRSCSDIKTGSSSLQNSVRPKHRSCSALSSSKTAPGAANQSASNQHDESGVDKLIRLMREQDAKLRNQMKRIRDIESEIELIETQKHISRIEEDGLDYIQQGYLPDPEPVTQEHVSFLEEQIAKEQQQIKELSRQVNGGSGDASSDPAIMREIKLLRTEIQNSIKVSMSQEKEMSTMSQTLNEMHSELENKAKHIINLVEELDHGVPDESKHDVTEYTILMQNRLGANTNMMDNIMQRYRNNMMKFEDVENRLDGSGDSDSDSGVSSQEAQSDGRASGDSDQDSSLENTLLNVSATTGTATKTTPTTSHSDSIHLNESTLPFSDRNSSIMMPSCAPGSCDTHNSTLLSSESECYLSRQHHININESLQPQQISIIGQNITIPCEQSLPNDTLQPLDVLVTREDVITSTPVPANRVLAGLRAAAPPQKPPVRRVAFADHDSIREISTYSLENTTIIEEDEGVTSAEEDNDDVASVTATTNTENRFVVTVHQQQLPSMVAVENVSYQQAIYNYSPTDESHNNFLLAGPVSRLQRKLLSRKGTKLKGFKKQKFIEKLMFLPNLARKARGHHVANANYTTYEDTFEDSYRHAILGNPAEIAQVLLHQDDVIQETPTPARENGGHRSINYNDVTLLRSYSIGDVGKIGYSWIDDQLGDLNKHHDSQLPTGWECNNPTGLETLV